MATRRRVRYARAQGANQGANKVDKRSGNQAPRPGELSRPAWVWDVDRARVCDANEAALDFWQEPTLADLLARDFDPDGPLAAALEAQSEQLGDNRPTEVRLPLTGLDGLGAARCETQALTLPDGRRGMLVQVLGAEGASNPDELARLGDAARLAPMALMSMDTSGRITTENDAARALFGEGREPVFAQRIGSSRMAADLIETCLVEGRASRSRKIPTRFGMRLCRLTARRTQDPVTARPAILVQAMDVEDERARQAERDAESAALAAFLDASADFYLELDDDLRVVRASSTLSAQLQLGPETPRSLHWREITAHHALETGQEIDAAMEARKGWSAGQLSVTDQDGRRVYATKGVALQNERGDFRGYRIVAHEVSVPHLAAEGVTPFPGRAPERPPTDDFADMVDAAPWAILVHRDFEPLYINRAFAETFGLDDSVLNSPSVVPVLSLFAEYEDALRDDNARLMADELAFTVRELSIRAPATGQMLTLQMRARRIVWSGAPATEYTLEDVTALRGAVTARGMDDTGTMSAVLDLVPEAVLLMEADGRIAWANLAALRLLDLPDAADPPHDITEVLGPEDTGWAQDYISGLAEGGLTHLFAEGREVSVVTASGERVSALMALERVGQGAGAKVCAVLRDISDWRGAETKAEEIRGEAEKSSDRKTEFLAKVSHELRTPLTAMLGFAQVLARQEYGPIGNPRYVEYAQDILGSGDHLLSLINDLLDMSKVESGKLDLSFASVDLHDLAEGCVRLMSPIAGSRQVTLSHRVADTLPSVVADERSLRQILLNLISNALRFTEGGGKVTVNGEIDDRGGLVLSVTDTGVGMSEAELAVALEPFEQVEKEVASGTPGTGLGLPLARALAEANRAMFAIESAPKAGTTVSLTFASTQVLSA